MREVDAARVRPLDDEALAAWLRRRGVTVVRRGRTHWRTTHPRFFEPLHWLARLPPEQVARPVRFALGFRSALTADGAGAATGALAVHVLNSVEEFSVEDLPAKRRSEVRKAARETTIVELTGPELLEREGHALFASVRRRTGHGRIPNAEKFAAGLKEYGVGEERTVIAGLVDGRLAGWLDGFGIDRVGYIDQVNVSDSALSTNLSTGLVYHWLEACRRGGVDTVVYGLHTPENESLSRYKERLGFRVERLPALVWLAPGVGPLLRRLRPHTAARLGG